MAKDFAAHNDTKSGATRLARFTANAPNNTLDSGAAGELFTDADGNNKPYKKDKLDYDSGRRSTHVIEDKGVGTTKKHRLVAKAFGMRHDLDDCSVSRRGLDVSHDMSDKTAERDALPTQPEAAA